MGNGFLLNWVTSILCFTQCHIVEYTCGYTEGRAEGILYRIRSWPDNPVAAAASKQGLNKSLRATVRPN